MTDKIVKEINETRDEYESFVHFLNDKYDSVDDKELLLATGWLEALNYVISKFESLSRTSMERAADSEDPNYDFNENRIKLQEMIHCEDGHCDT